MVGALADWFAVTALFKHPLGIPIPHTAIIKRKKDQLGEGLGAFVRENFMSPEVIETKLRDAEVAGRLGKWLSEPLHAERVAAEASTALRVLVEMLRDEDVQAVLDRARADELAVLDRVRAAGEVGGRAAAVEALWAWLATPEHRALVTLWVEGYARALVEPGGAWAGFAARTVRDWLAVLDDVGGGDVTDRTLLLAVLRGALLDLLATGDLARTGAAVARFLQGASGAS